MIRFEDLISPTEPGHFFHSHWERAFLWVERAAPDYYADVLTAGDIDDLFRSGRLPAGQVKAVSEGANMAACRPGQAPFADVAELFRAYAGGATLVIDGGHHLIPRLNRFCAYLEAELKLRVQANIYITPPRARGLTPHFDTHDVMVVQIAGQKDWRLYGHTDRDCPMPDTTRQIPRDAQLQPERQMTLRAGDLLYLPRGLIHDASGGDGPSIHIALGLKPDLRLDLLQELVGQAAENSFFRKALPTGFSREGEAAALGEAFKRALLSLVEEMDIDELLERRRRAFLRDRLPEREGQFLDLLRLDQVTLDTVLCRRPAQGFAVDRDGDEIVVTSGPHRISVPCFLAETMRAIAGGAPFVLRDLPGLLDDAGKIVLARQFIQAGLLRIQDAVTP